jgi:hypothetical protein
VLERLDLLILLLDPLQKSRRIRLGTRLGKRSSERQRQDREDRQSRTNRHDVPSVF